MSKHLARQLKDRIACKLSAFYTNGGWLCRRCGKVIVREHPEQSMPCCPECKSVHLKFSPPAP